MIQMHNIKLGVSDIIYFWIIVIKDTHTHRPTAKNVTQGTSKRINPSKSIFGKFELKSILSLPHMGKRK